LRVVSNRKGSNPGGFAYLEDIYVYVKYSQSGDLRGAPLKVEHQPFYEYITAEILQYYGLGIPKMYVLRGEELTITNEVDNPDFYCKRPYYFASVYVEHTPNGTLTAKQQDVIEMFGVCDVIGRGDNYGIKTDGTPIIIDCGCSFFESVGGIMRVRENFNRIYHKILKRGIKIKSKEKRESISRLLSFIENMEVDLYSSKVPLRDILEKDEMEFIKLYYKWKISL